MSLINAIHGARGMAVTPHALAAQSALAILREGGNAVEAMISAAATIAVAYPHMNSIGGDGFWLISRPGESPSASRRAARRHKPLRSRPTALVAFNPSRFAARSRRIRSREPCRGWALAHRWSTDTLGGKLPASRLLADAIAYAGRAYSRHAQSIPNAPRASWTELAIRARLCAETFLRADAAARRGRLRVSRSRSLPQRSNVSLMPVSTIFIAATLRAASRAICEPRKSAGASRSGTAQRAASRAASTHAFARHRLQHAAAHARACVAPDSRRA